MACEPVGRTAGGRAASLGDPLRYSCGDGGLQLLPVPFAPRPRLPLPGRFHRGLQPAVSFDRRPRFALPLAQPPGGPGDHHCARPWLDHGLSAAVQHGFLADENAHAAAAQSAYGPPGPGPGRSFLAAHRPRPRDRHVGNRLCYPRRDLHYSSRAGYLAARLSSRALFRDRAGGALSPGHSRHGGPPWPGAAAATAQSHVLGGRHCAGPDALYRPSRSHQSPAGRYRTGRQIRERQRAPPVGVPGGDPVGNYRLRRRVAPGLYQQKCVSHGAHSKPWTAKNFSGGPAGDTNLRSRHRRALPSGVPAACTSDSGTRRHSDPAGHRCFRHSGIAGGLGQPVAGRKWQPRSCDHGLPGYHRAPQGGARAAAISQPPGRPGGRAHARAFRREPAAAAPAADRRELCATSRRRSTAAWTRTRCCRRSSICCAR